MSHAHAKRHTLVAELRAEGIHHPVVLAAMASVPRHLFVPKAIQRQAYENSALPIGLEQTISQPFIVARMSEALLGKKERLGRVLEIGTGSGYQAAILATFSDEVYSIERMSTLYQRANLTLKTLKYKNVFTRHGDGQLGWSEQAPFDAIIVTAAIPTVPPILLRQLADSGVLIAPVATSEWGQQLQLMTRHGNEFKTTLLDPVLFVPLKSGVSDE